jgi:hypothetical protein
MNIPRFWASSDCEKPFLCWQWSNDSPEHARLRADEKSRLLALRWERDETLDRYAYGNGAIREEIVETIAGLGGEPTAIITRNLYGSLVLNTTAVMFIDIDFPPIHKRGLLSGLFRKRVEQEDNQKAALDKLDAWAATRRDLGMRAYRTCAGLRCLVTSHLFDPTDAQSIAMLESAGSDPLYIRLCQAQACFRARLTPKPWRAGAKVPPGRYPFASDEQVAKHRKWQADYDRAITHFSVCRLIRQIGVDETLPEVRPLLVVHDKLTAIAANRPLA